MLWLQSGQPVVNFALDGGFNILETAQRMWLRILSIVFEKKLKVFGLCLVTILVGLLGLF